MAGLCTVVVIGGIFAFNSMRQDTLLKSAMNSVAEARHYLKAASAGNFTIHFTAGMREEPFAQDGVAGTPTPFILLSVTGDERVKGMGNLDATVRIGEESHNVTLLQNPYNAMNFTNDIARTVGREVLRGEEIEVTLNINNTTQPRFNLTDTMGADSVTWEQALAIALDKLGGELRGKTFETFVSIVHSGAEGAHAFWYVQFITTEQTTMFAVIAQDGSVVSR